MFSDDIEDFVEGVKRKVTQATGRVPLTELLHPTFMRIHTKFQTVEEMIDASPFNIRSADDFKLAIGPEWDKYVAEVSTFSSWQQMINQAAADRVRRHVNR